MNRRTNGALMSYLLIFVRLVVTLIYTPILVVSLGQEAYGLFALVGALAAYLYILDFGLNDSVLRFFVSHENDHATRNAFLSRMLFVYACIGGLVMGLAVLVAANLDIFFGAAMTTAQLDDLRTMLLITGASAAILVWFNPIAALLSACERFVFLRGLEIATLIFSTILTVILLTMGYRVLAVVTIAAGVIIVQVAVRIAYVVSILGVKLHLAWPDHSELSTVGRYAAPIFVSMIAEVIFWRLDSVLIGSILGAAPIAVYAIGVTFNKYFMSFATALSRVMTPEIVRRIDAGADSKTITSLMIRISRSQALVLLLILGGLTVFGQRFLTLWLSPDYALSYWIMMLVLVPYALELTGNARNIVLQVHKLYWYKSLITLGTALLNIPLTLLFLSFWGVAGAAAATGLALIINYIMIAVLLQRRVGVAMGRYWAETARGILPVFGLLVVIGLMLEPYLRNGWAGLALGAALFMVIYIAAMTRFAVNQDEKEMFNRIFVHINKLISRIKS